MVISNLVCPKEKISLPPKKLGLRYIKGIQHRILGAGPDIMWSANTACPHAYSHIIGSFNTTFQSMPQGLIYSGSHLCLNTPVFCDGKFMVGKARWFDIAAYGPHKP